MFTTDCRSLIGSGRFHLGTETEAAKYRRRVPSASRELAIARLGRFVMSAQRVAEFGKFMPRDPCVVREIGLISACFADG